MAKKQLKKTTLYVKGMHCPSCDILVKDKLKECPYIKEVKADHKNQTAEVYYEGEIDKSELNSKINPFGYSVTDKKEEEFKEPFLKRVTDAAAIAVILFIAFYFFGQLNIFPDVTKNTSVSYLTVFLLGLVASTSTCMATSGALFMATVGKLNNRKLSFRENIIPAVSFNVGRIASYGVFGFLVGMVGKVLFDKLHLGSLVTVFVSAVMLLIGLEMLKIISFSWVSSTSFTKGIFEKLESKFISHPKQMALLLGAITYLLPCGFTQSVQMYALGLANPVQSALIMMTFALVTFPALLSIGFLSSFTRSPYYPLFAKVMGVVVVMLGLNYMVNFASLNGLNLASVFSLPSTQVLSANTTTEEDSAGYQIIHMSVDTTGYVPNIFTVKAGQPVKWEIEGKTNFGCQTSLVAPKLGVNKFISLGQNEPITFTPQEKGDINFSCEMNMYRGTIHVI
jgi:sulfite exporter TauE/SafE/copper chaperone CopZ